MFVIYVDNMMIVIYNVKRYLVIWCAGTVAAAVLRGDGLPVRQASVDCDDGGGYVAPPHNNYLRGK